MKYQITRNINFFFIILEFLKQNIRVFFSNMLRTCISFTKIKEYT